MKMKRIMALVMTSAMVMGTLAGCGASTDTTDTTQSQSENNSTAAAATTETASEEKEWYGTEDGKTVTLQFWGGIQPEYGYDEVVENFNKEYADKGVQVEYNRYVNNSDGNLQLETYLMAGEDGGVDVFIGYGSKTPWQPVQMADCYMITVITWIPSDLISVKSWVKIPRQITCLITAKSGDFLLNLITMHT